MIQKARFINIENQLRLCLVSYVNGNIVDINGPVQCVSEKDASVAQFIHSMDELLTEAAHGSAVLELSDLPEDIRKDLEKAISDRKIIEQAMHNEAVEELPEDLKEAAKEEVK